MRRRAASASRPFVRSTPMKKRPLATPATPFRRRSQWPRENCRRSMHQKDEFRTDVDATRRQFRRRSPRGARRSGSRGRRRGSAGVPSKTIPAARRGRRLDRGRRSNRRGAMTAWWCSMTITDLTRVDEPVEQSEQLFNVGEVASRWSARRGYRPLLFRRLLSPKLCGHLEPAAARRRTAW